MAWQKKRFRDYWRRLSQSGKPGRPAISKEVIELIRDMWRSNPTWGSPRIEGELGKLGITVAKSTVEKYRPRLRNPPSPWKAFLANHVIDIREGQAPGSILLVGRHEALPSECPDWVPDADRQGFYRQAGAAMAPPER